MEMDTDALPALPAPKTAGRPPKSSTYEAINKRISRALADKKGVSSQLREAAKAHSRCLARIDEHWDEEGRLNAESNKEVTNPQAAQPKVSKTSTKAKKGHVSSRTKVGPINEALLDKFGVIKKKDQFGKLDIPDNMVPMGLTREDVTPERIVVATLTNDGSVLCQTIPYTSEWAKLRENSSERWINGQSKVFTDMDQVKENVDLTQGYEAVTEFTQLKVSLYNGILDAGMNKWTWINDMDMLRNPTLPKLWETMEDGNFEFDFLPLGEQIQRALAMTLRTNVSNTVLTTQTREIIAVATKLHLLEGREETDKWKDEAEGLTKRLRQLVNENNKQTWNNVRETVHERQTPRGQGYHPDFLQDVKWLNDMGTRFCILEPKAEPMEE